MSTTINIDVAEYQQRARDRLVELLRKAGPQKVVAEKLSISVPTLQRVLAGTSPVDMDLLFRASELVQVPLPEILIGKIAAQRRAEVSPTETVTLREIDLAYGLGSTYLDDGLVEVAHRTFAADFVRQFTKSPPDQLFLARGAGDSMMPTIYDGDTLMFDTAQNTPTMADRIWVMTYAGMGTVKRIRGRPDGGLDLLSDNPAIPVTTAYDGEAHVIGRVVAVIRKM